MTTNIIPTIEFISLIKEDIRDAITSRGGNLDGVVFEQWGAVLSGLVFSQDTVQSSKEKPSKVTAPSEEIEEEKPEINTVYLNGPTFNLTRGSDTGDVVTTVTRVITTSTIEPNNQGFPASHIWITKDSSGDGWQFNYDIAAYYDANLTQPLNANGYGGWYCDDAAEFYLAITTYGASWENIFIARIVDDATYRQNDGSPEPGFPVNAVGAESAWILQSNVESMVSPTIDNSPYGVGLIEIVFERRFLVRVRDDLNGRCVSIPDYSPLGSHERPYDLNNGYSKVTPNDEDYSYFNDMGFAGLGRNTNTERAPPTFVQTPNTNIWTLTFTTDAEGYGGGWIFNYPKGGFTHFRVDVKVTPIKSEVRVEYRHSGRVILMNAPYVFDGIWSESDPTDNLVDPTPIPEPIPEPPPKPIPEPEPDPVPNPDVFGYSWYGGFAETREELIDQIEMTPWQRGWELDRSSFKLEYTALRGMWMVATMRVFIPSGTSPSKQGSNISVEYGIKVKNCWFQAEDRFDWGGLYPSQFYDDFGDYHVGCNVPGLNNIYAVSWNEFIHKAAILSAQLDYGGIAYGELTLGHNKGDTNSGVYTPDTVFEYRIMYFDGETEDPYGYHAGA